MHIDKNRLLVLGYKDCARCDKGTVAKEILVLCDACNGTGKRGRGKCRKCAETFSITPIPVGMVRKWDHEDREICRHCGGDFRNAQKESYYDKVPKRILETLSFEVIGTGDRELTWRESHLGIGLYSVVDYGEHKKLSKEELITKVRKDTINGYHQAIKLINSKEYPKLCSGIYIYPANQGYSVIPYYVVG